MTREVRDPLDEFDADPELTGRVRALPQEVEPERDLWPGIAARLRPERSGHRRRWLLTGLAATLLLAAGVEIGRRAERPAPIASAPAPAAPSGPALAAYAETGAALDAVRDQLRAEIDRHSDALPPEARAAIFDNLATIDRAIAEIEAELAEHPDDPELARAYIRYRHRQVDFLRRANRSAARL